jgi:galactitol-specific phosphotransferase system IIB component
MMVKRDDMVNDICGEKYYYFLQYFSSFKTDITNVKEKQDKALAMILIDKLKNSANFNNKLKNIYGTNVILEENQVVKQKINKIIKVYYINEDSWEEWFNEFMTTKGKRIIDFFNSCYNSDKKQYVVSTVYNELQY